MKRLWNDSLLLKFLLTYLLIVAFLFASFFFYSNSILRRLYVSSLGERMARETRLVGYALARSNDSPPLDAICRMLAEKLGARVTVIAVTGRVLGDSAEPSAEMENHASRPEVVRALAAGSGSSIRYSTTIGYELLYSATLDTTGPEPRIVRIAIPLEEIDRATDALRARLLGGLLAVSGFGLALALFFSRRFSRRIARLTDFSRRLAAGSFPRNFFPPRGRDEIHLLEQNLNEMSAKLEDNLWQVVREKEKLDSILRCMAEGVLVLDRKGRVVLLNEQAKAIFHVPPDRDVHGLSVTDLSRHPELRALLQNVLAVDWSREIWSDEIALEQERWFRVNAARLSSGPDRSIGSVLVFHDVTEIKRFEALRSDFVANVSHELRTPLTAIRGYVETLLHSPPEEPSRARQFLETIERHAERLGRLTEDLLTLSDLESGRTPLARAPVGVHDLIQRVMEVLSDRARKKSLEVTVDIQPELPALLGDFDRLQQLFINVIDNAVKYTPPGGRVAIAARKHGQVPDMGVEIAVADTGPGIPDHHLPRLTERFYRVDRARSRDLGGTGLGLAIVKHIVQAHGGELRIESGLSAGTTVRVTLPVAVTRTAAVSSASEDGYEET